MPGAVAVDGLEADAHGVDRVADAAAERGEVAAEHRLHDGAGGRAHASVGGDGVVERRRAVALEVHASGLPARRGRQARHTGRVNAPQSLEVALATVQAFADAAGAERVVVLLDGGEGSPPVIVERLEDGGLQVTEGESARPAAPAAGVAPLPLPELRAVPASAMTADAETGELAAPLGSVQLLADSVLALARALGGRSVATATFATRDPDLSLTVAARDGEPVVLDLAGRHFALPPAP